MEDMCRHNVRAQCDVVAAVVPVIVDAGEEIFNLEVFVVWDSEFFKVEIDPAGLLLSWIEVDGDEYSIVSA